MAEQKSSIIVRSLAAALALIGLSYGQAEAASFFTSELRQLNNSGVQGTADLTLNEDLNTLTVTIRATGLEPRRVHPITIEGDFNGHGNAKDSDAPTRLQDTDSDGYIELAEVQRESGTVLLALSTPPDGVLAYFPSTNDGNLTYTATYNLNEDWIFPRGYDSGDITPLDYRHIVVYGGDVNGSGENTEGEVNGTPGYKIHLPVAFGNIEKANWSSNNTLSYNGDHQIPEPSTVGLIVTALGALAFARRRD